MEEKDEFCSSAFGFFSCCEHLSLSNVKTPGMTLASLSLLSSHPITYHGGFCPVSASVSSVASQELYLSSHSSPVLCLTGVSSEDKYPQWRYSCIANPFVQVTPHFCVQDLSLSLASFRSVAQHPAMGSHLSCAVTKVEGPVTLG